MVEQHRVIVGVDGSEDGLRAVRYGVGEAKRRDADLLVVHGVDDAVLAGTWGTVYDPSLLEEAGRNAVDEAKALAVEAGLPADRVQGEVLVGNPASVLIRCSEEADRVVVGRRAGGGLERMFIGSTSVSVASAARCPVITISAAVNPGPTGNFHRIGVGVGTDGPIRGTGAIGWAFEEGRLRQAKVVIFHVVEPPPAGLFGRGKQVTPEEQERLKAAAHEQISAALAPLVEANPGVEHEVQVSYGRIIDTLTAATNELDLLIVGAHTGGFGQSLGGVVRGLMSHALCPVGVIRASKG